MNKATGLDWQIEYNYLKKYAIMNNMRNLIIALELAVKYHQGQYRDSGEPYIIHPLMVCKTLILLSVETYLNKWYPEKSNQWIKHQLDVLYATAVLHDVIEDCDLPNKGIEFVVVYHLDREVWINVNILSKDKSYDPDEYYMVILSRWMTTLIKLADRANNCTTMEVFDKERKKKYIREVNEYIYPLLCAGGKMLYPQFSNVIKILENLIVSICESLASILEMKEMITKNTENYQEMIDFIEGSAKKEKMRNTYISLSMAQNLYKGNFRTSGDPFIIHPLRVSSYLITLGIMDDITNAVALLHEKAHWGSDEDVKNSAIDPEVTRIVDIVSNKDMPLKDYYERIKKEPRAILEKLSNRAHTCTFLAKATYDEMKAYTRENQEYVVPMCEDAKIAIPQYANQIDIMQYHILSISNIVEVVTRTG